MDLRVDFAFKTFIEGNPEALISLLNVIFANAKINRIVKSVRLKNPNMDKKSLEDKLSILDVRAELEDGTDILIEMHLHGINQLKSKNNPLVGESLQRRIRSRAKIHRATPNHSNRICRRSG